MKNIVITEKEYSIEIDPWEDAKYTTLFVGKNGTVLKQDCHLNAAYQFKGDEGYVRAKVISSTGDFAITQPVFIKPNEP